jgi:DNA-directed RNA polymerase subunit RPC12/RpoP
MASGPVKDAGEETACPSCGATVLTKKMIPILAADGTAAPTYVCVECARAARPEHIAAGEALRAPSDA